jgi:hypothetical protein
MPGARRARSLVCKSRKHTSVVTTVTPETPGIPRAMVLTVSFVLSPVTGLVCHRRPRKLPFANLMPASGHQDHTTLPSASAPFVKGAIRVHRIPHSTSVTIAKRPYCRGGTGRIGKGDLPDGESGKFFTKGLDMFKRAPPLICPSGKSHRPVGRELQPTCPP